MDKQIGFKTGNRTGKTNIALEELKNQAGFDAIDAEAARDANYTLEDQARDKAKVIETPPGAIVLVGSKTDEKPH